MPSSPRLYLVDGHAHIYRAFFGIPHLTNSKGFPTNAVYGFSTMLFKLIREKKPDYLAVAFDSKGPTKRHEEFVEYKAQRPEMPDLLQPQIPVIHRLVEALRIPVLIQEGYEADDLIGTAARLAEEKKIHVTVVSGDKDMYQLVSPQTNIYDSLKERTIGEPEVRERFGVKPGQLVEIMGLMGDKIDNIPGVPGIGEKTAVRLIEKYGSVENLLKRAGEIDKPKLRENILRNAEQARLSLSLATIDRHCPLDFDLDRYRLSEPDQDSLVSLLKEMEFSSLLRQFEKAPSQDQATGVEELKTQKAALKFIRYCSTQKKVALTLWEEEGGEGKSHIVRGVLACGNRVAALSGAAPVEWIKPLLEDKKINKVMHDLKTGITLCGKNNLSLKGPFSDTLIASYLLNPNRRDHSLETEVLSHLGIQLPEGPKNSKKDFRLEDRTRLAEAHTPSILSLDAKLGPLLKKQGLMDLYHKTELPLVEVLAEMEEAGIKLDTEKINNLSKELGIRLEDITRRIHALAGTPFNQNSPKQLSEILFEKLGLQPIKKTKTGYSTNEEVLQQLSLQHELPGEILGYRQLSKLKSTYLDTLPRLVNPETGRLHSSFNQAVTATGRLSSSDPNLQNIPIKGEWGRRIREAFVAESDRLLLSADYNQVELRILAHLSGDRSLRSAFKKGEDVHSKTAEQIFGLGPESVTPEMRRTAKSVNFGIVYGISPFGLSTTLGITQAEAKEYISRYLESFSGVRRFMDQTVKTAREKGYVTTLFGRRRAIPELASPTPALRAVGERAALNTPIQGSAADVIKAAMIAISARIRNEKLLSRMLLQIHDELIFEVPKEEVDRMKILVREEMEGAVTLKVPLKVDLGLGKNWAEAHG